MTTARENWVDTVKGLAILLVAVFHGFQGLLGAGLFPSHAAWWNCNTAVYCFHVQLLFLCSGYLWQRYGRSGGWRSHVRAVRGKAWCLGVPYVVFTTLSWALRTLWGHSVNHPAGTLWRELLVVPAPPYWFLPALFLLFALFPRTNGKRSWGWLFATAVAAKAASVAWDGESWFFPARTTAQQAFWFVSGMGIAHLGTGCLGGKTGQRIGVACAVLFLAGATAASATGMWWCKAAKWALGVLACTAVLLWAIRRDASHPSPGLWEALGRHSMPVFLMHTMCAAAVRIGLIALDVRTLWVHIPAMFAASIAGPLVAMHVLEWVHLDGLVDPRRWRTARIGLSKDGPRK